MLVLLLSCASVPSSAPVPSAPAPAPVAPAPVPATPAPAQPASCQVDEDCGWNDPCSPSFCGTYVPPPPNVRCGRPSTPGECLCAAGTCTLMRRQPEPNPVACQSDAECGFDPTLGVCTAGSGSSGAGVSCACATVTSTDHRCVRTFSGEVPCKEDADCSWQHVNGAGTRAVPSWLEPRPVQGPVKPCKDSETDSVCSEKKICELRHWKC